jgi:hypothetical protein
MHECMNEMMMPRLSWVPATQVHKHQIPGILALGLVLGLNPKPSKQLWKIIRRFRAVRVSCRYENHAWFITTTTPKFHCYSRKRPPVIHLVNCWESSKVHKIPLKFCLSVAFFFPIWNWNCGGTQIASANLASCGGHHKCWKQQANPDYYRDAREMWDQTPKRLYATKVFLGGI